MAHIDSENQNNSRINSFLQYFNSVKPYHTKILEIVYQFNINEVLNVELDDSDLFFDYTYQTKSLCDGDCSGSEFDYMDSIGGYGILYDDSSVVRESGIDTINYSGSTPISIEIPEDHTYDYRFQILEIPNNNEIILEGDQRTRLSDDDIVRLIPNKTYEIISTTTNTITVSGEHANDITTAETIGVFGASYNNGSYAVINAQESGGNTTITIPDNSLDDNIQFGFVDIETIVKNRGFYDIATVSQNLINANTQILLHPQKLLDLTDDDETLNHGTIVLKKAFSPNRILRVFDQQGGTEIKQLTVRFSEYNYDTDKTIISFMENISLLTTNSYLVMNGSIINYGYDGNPDTGAPYDHQIYTNLSEYVLIENISVSLTPTVTPTITPSTTAEATPTPTPTASVTPSITVSPTITPTVTPTETPPVTPDASVSPTPTVTPSASASVDYGPGPQTLQAGDFQTAGYFGEVTAAELYSGDDLALDIGLSAGTSQFSTEGWLKFWHDGKVKYIAKKTFRRDLSWDSIDAVNVVYASDNTTVSTGGYNFLVRLMTGANTDPYDDTGWNSTNSCQEDLGGGSEWNELIYRVVQEIPDCTNTTSFHGGPQLGGNWDTLAESDIGLGGSGRRTWTQETPSSSITRRTYRGLNFVYQFYHTESTSVSEYAWRPVLELL